MFSFNYNFFFFCTPNNNYGTERHSTCFRRRMRVYYKQTNATQQQHHTPTHMRTRVCGTASAFGTHFVFLFLHVRRAPGSGLTCNALVFLFATYVRTENHSASGHNSLSLFWHWTLRLIFRADVVFCWKETRRIDFPKK